MARLKTKDSMRRPPESLAPPDAAKRRAVRPTPVYAGDQLPTYDADFYQGVRAAMTKTSTMIVPPRDARAFVLCAGDIFRIVSVDGPQVGDLNLWNRHDLSERFFSGKTRAIHATHVSAGDRLWSTLPFLRPMATITYDTLDWYGWVPMALACMMSSEPAVIPIPPSS
jgi:uncharacterized protein YcgI (DUF1989 family)